VQMPGLGALPPTSLPVARTLDFLDPESDDSDTVWYGTFVEGLTNAAPQGQSTLQIDKACDFYWVATTVQASTIQADDNSTAQTQSSLVIPLVNINIKDYSSQRDFVNLSLPLASIAGVSGERPYRLVSPRRISAQTVVLFTYNAIVTAAGAPTPQYDLYVVLHGFTLPPR
jgi:hypothetical protein